MKIVTFLLSLLFLSSGAIAQNSKVIPLSSDDAVMAKAKYDALQAAQKAWSDFQDKMALKYIYVKQGDPEQSSYEAPVTVNKDGTMTFINPCANPQTPKDKKDCAAAEKAEKEREESIRYFRLGFENGFEFDKSFRFIVPKPSPPPSSSCYIISTSGTTSSSSSCPNSWAPNLFHEYSNG